MSSVTKRPFIITKEEDNFLLGHFADESYSGVYLTAEYLGRLRQILYAVETRLDILGKPELSDAINNLLGVVDRLTRVHREQMRVENTPLTAGDLEAYTEAQREIEQAMKDLQGFPRPPN